MVKRIGFNNDTDTARPFYVWEDSGETKFVKLGGDGLPPVGAHVPVGNTVAKYASLTEAQSAHPDAKADRNARGAVASGNYR